jgi:hypothetical protein
MTERSDITLSIDAVRGEVSKFDRIAAGLADLERAHPKDVVYPVATPDGMEQATVARRSWREPRIALEKARKAAKAPVLQLGREIDSFAGDLEEKLREGEDHYDAQIKAEEGRREAERQRKLQAEAERIAAIRRRIIEALTFGPNPSGLRYSVEQLQGIRDRIATVEIEGVDDLKFEVDESRARTLKVLDEAIAEQRSLEAESDRLAAERAALAEERRVAREESARQEAQIAAQRAELDRRDKEAREAERVRLLAVWEAEQRVTKERVAQEVAEAQRRAAVAAAAPAMRDLLADWRDCDLLAFDSEDELRRARQTLADRRDRILSDLRVIDAQTESPA